MKIFPSSILPRRLGLPKQNGDRFQSTQSLTQFAVSEIDEVLRRVGTQLSGLSEDEALDRLEKYGPNTVAQEKRYGRLHLFGKALINPLIILLSILAVVSALTGDLRAAFVMSLMVVVSVLLRFIQEARADSAAAKLKAMIRVTATVVRDGEQREVPLSELVTGDIVKFSAGDMIPADVRLIESKDFFVIQSILTGESFPVEKTHLKENKVVKSPVELSNICFLGTSVESGTATAVVIETGFRTYLGRMARSIVEQQPQTAFDKGVARFTWLMIRFMMVMVPLVFVINGITKGDWKEAFFFALSVAVGMTPEMLPMIVTVCLSRGAMAMSKKKVIVKHLNSIQNLGAMDVLCTDKTGTLTMDRVVLEKHCDLMLEENEEVLLLAYLNSHFQTSLKNVLDRAVLAHREVHDQFHVPDYIKEDEIPFDFNRRLMSVVLKTPKGENLLICKGAPEEVFKRCSRFEYKNDLYNIDEMWLNDIRIEYDKLGRDGFRVLAIAYRYMEKKPAYSKEDERDLILKGYVAFFDPPKETAPHAVAALHRHGVAVKVLTGDNEAVTRKVCKDVEIPTAHVINGDDVEHMTDEDLEGIVEETTIFTRLAPAHKQRIVRALQRKGHVVGFLGDGINDAPALRAADVGISVDSAVDIAKESADLILLEKSLMVLEEGILEGRKVFANILKYIRMGASSAFGNMFSVVGASAFLPFLPMAPLQILTNNMLYDFSQVPIPTDNVDHDEIKNPRPWSMGEITRFILFIGPCSSIFDYTTYFIMLYIFDCWKNAPLFQTGWFIESLLTQTFIIHVIRTKKVPFVESLASRPLILTTMVIMMIGMWLPYSPIAGTLGFVRPPLMYWPLVVLTLVCYMVLTQIVKVWLMRKRWI
ncbi:MAG: magnesium-translocating P-type ATPase [Dissulfurimicrobium hydrothermale]|uniref:magnesium-translocating P-type ATPase n=1 Tax=Dissulfurimicrobium hydrothermale TaxID=1750598 RepID=UPI003C745FDD